MFRKIISLTLLVVLAGNASSQTAGEKQPSEDKDKQRKEAVAFLREAIADVTTMRSLENRISFTSEMAGLMWFHDEKEARAMFTNVISDFRHLLLQYDGQMNEMEIDPGEMTGHFGGFLSGNKSDSARLMRRFTAALSVRQQIAMSIAEHDADLAFGFYNESMGAISSVEFRKQLEGRDTFFEYQLAAQIAEHSAAKGLHFAKKMLDDGVNYQHIELLKKLYAKDAEKGAELAEAMLSKLKDGKANLDEQYILSSFLTFAGDTFENSKKEGGKKAALNREQLRELADILGRAMLERADEEFFDLTYIDKVEKYAPSRASQVKAKFKGKPNAHAANTNAGFNMVDIPAPAATNANIVDAKRQEEQEKAEKALMEDVLKVGTKELPKEERERIIGQARKILAQTPGRDKKITGLSMLAAQVSRAGDKELAAEIMKDAAALVSPSPKSYEDYLYTWMLTMGYAEADPDRAFALLEDTIGRANQTIEAFVKVGEFFDVAEEMIRDGEVQVGAFGGQMVRDLTRELGVAESTIGFLVDRDFVKTKNLTNRFDRLEVRIMAKMMVLRAALSAKVIKTDKPGLEGQKTLTLGSK